MNRTQAKKFAQMIVAIHDEMDSECGLDTGVCHIRDRSLGFLRKSQACTLAPECWGCHLVKILKLQNVLK